jgi:hypothetical protein
LVRVSEPAPFGIAQLLGVAEDLIHGRQASRGDVSEMTGNLI